MSINAIVSYDGTANDDDALELASVLADLGAQLTLVYVRHNQEHTLEDAAAQALLHGGVERLGDATLQTRVAVHASTAEGLRELALEQGAELVVFGSAYRTPVGRVSPQTSTERLLQNGSFAVAIAPSGYVAKQLRTIGVLAGSEDDAAIDTARALADATGATVTEDTEHVDLLIVGSRPEASTGQVQITAQAEHVIDGAAAPVLVVARGAALSFGQAALATA